MPFLAAAIPAIIGAVGTAGAAAGPALAAAAPSLISSVGGGLLSKAVGGPNGATSTAQNVLSQTGQSARDTGMNYLNQFGNTLAGPQNYFQNILSGNRAATTSSISPDISRLFGALRNTSDAVGNLSPRGGGRSSTLFDLPYAGTSGVQGLFNTARTNAATALPQIAGQYGAVGGNLFNTGANAANSLSNSGLLSQDHQYQVGKDLGSGLYQISKNVPWGKIFKGAGGADVGSDGISPDSFGGVE